MRRVGSCPSVCLSGARKRVRMRRGLGVVWCGVLVAGLLVWSRTAGVPGVIVLSYVVAVETRRGRGGGARGGEVFTRS